MVAICELSAMTELLILIVEAVACSVITSSHAHMNLIDNWELFVIWEARVIYI